MSYTVIPFVNAGNISAKETALNAVTAWANDCERRLIIGLSCGTVLPRERHREWARERMIGAMYRVRRTRKGVIGVVMLKRSA